VIEPIAPPSYVAAITSGPPQRRPSPPPPAPGSIPFPTPSITGGGSGSESTAARPIPEKPQVERLAQTGFAREDFGSRFIPHSNDRITCVLPLMAGTLILFGTTTGLKVLSTNRGTTIRNVWTGLPVWDIRVLRITAEEGRTPKGSALVLCGGAEDPNNPGKPKSKGGEVEARVWKLGSLASLGRWAVTLGESWEGLDLTPPPRKTSKGKGKEKAPVNGAGARPIAAGTTPGRPISEEELRMAKDWSSAFVSLPTSTSTKPADIISVATRTHEPEIYVAIATPSHVLLHIGQSSASGFSFRACKIFYLPMGPARIGLIELARNAIVPPSRRESRDGLDKDRPWPEPGILGIYVSFGSRACVIRSDNSAVVDFQPPSGRGRGRGGGEWGDMQPFRVHDTEMYLFTRGSETLIYPVGRGSCAEVEPLLTVQSPLRLPIATPPIVDTVWPEIPSSVLAVPDGSKRDDAGFTLVSTNPSGEICTQHAVSNGKGSFAMLNQEATIFGHAKMMPIAWEGEEVYAALGGKDRNHRVVRLERAE
jgi:hypothetical protein